MAHFTAAARIRLKQLSGPTAKPAPPHGRYPLRAARLGEFTRRGEEPPVSQHRVVIEVSPTRLDIATLRAGQVAARQTLRFAALPFADEWPKVLDRLSDRLASAIDEVNATGLPATILYAAPTSAAGLFSCPASAGRAQALRAGTLALAEAAGIDLRNQPHGLEIIAADSGPADPSSGPQVHCLGAADTEVSSNALAAWARAAGVNPDQLIPIDVPALSAAVDLAGAGGADGVRVALYVGQNKSVLAAGSPGRLRFVREMAIGADSLVEALAAKFPTSDPTEYPHAAADFLSNVGIPTREQAIEGAQPLQASDVLPLLRPTLQRWVLEIRQSLRFGLSEPERPTARLIGIGPGAAIPRLIAVLAEQAGLTHEPTQTSETSAIDTWLTSRQPAINLVPATVRDAAVGRRIRRGVWVGTAVTTCLIVGNTLLTRADLSQTKSQVAALNARLAAAHPAAELSDKIAALRTTIQSARSRIAARLGPSAEWDAALAMLSRITPAQVRLGQIQFSIDGGHPVCHVQGTAPVANGGETTLKQYLDNLATVPIVNGFKMGTTQRDEQTGGAVQTFEVALTLVNLPATASVGEEVR